MKRRSFLPIILFVAVALLLDLGPDGVQPAAVQAQGDFSCSSVTEIPQVECEALVALYNSTDGPNWFYSYGWLVTSTPCSWYGVTCEAGHVQTISLGWNKLSGSIPPELGNLINLTILVLDVNELVGSIPPELGNLGSLSSLYLNSNQLSGSIPPELGNLTNLYDLLLDSNQLSGSIPAELGNLVKVQQLFLSGNQLSGSIPPELGNLVNLIDLWLFSNNLTGSIPPEIGNLTGLERLNLEDNQLNGSIPSELGNMTRLRYLYLNTNQLSGSIPPQLGNMTSLHMFHLYENQLSGELPRSLMNLSILYHFDFHSTFLCEPPDDEFQAWLASIPDLVSTGVICERSPSVGTFEPNLGSGWVGDWAVFTTTYSDPNGYDDIQLALFFLDRQPPIASGGVAAGYIQSADLLWLKGGTPSSICRPGQPVAIETDFARLDCGGSSVTGIEETLTITWHIQPKQCFTGGCGWNYAFELVTDSTGFQDMGVVGYWQLSSASGVLQNERLPESPTKADGSTELTEVLTEVLAEVLEQLREEIEDWQSQLRERYPIQR